MSGHDAPNRNADLAYRLRSLGMAAAVLHVGSHPDDEEAGLMAYLSRGRGVRTVYWSATRGEGGQNRSGPERGKALGILRTWESLDARAVDGGEVLYGPFYDFGFSKSAQDCLARWDREAVLRELVRAIRFVQPLVVVSRWTGSPEDGHGQHEAIGLVAEEAFDVAGDGARFPELLGEGLPPWEPQKLYRSAVGDWQPGEDVAFGLRIAEFESAGLLAIDTGQTDPVSGRTFQELAWLGMNRHRTQAMAFVPRRGEHLSYFRLDRSRVEVPRPERDVFDGLDPRLPGLVRMVGGEAPELRSLLEEASALAADAVARFRPDRPGEAGRLALDALVPLRKAEAFVGDRGADGSRTALGPALRRKVSEFEEVAAACLGLDLECLVDEDLLTPGRRLLVRTRLWAPEPVDPEISVEVPEGWTSAPLERHLNDRGPSGAEPVLTAAFDVTVPEAAALSPPYWLREPRTPYRYVLPERPPPGLPFDGPLISADCRVVWGRHRLTITRAAVHREPSAGGFREQGPRVVPPVSLLPRERRKLLPVTGRRERLELHLAARSMQDDVVGTLVAEAPNGWEVHPSELELRFDRIGTLRTVRFELEVPPTAKPGVHQLTYRVVSRNRDYGVVLRPVLRRPPAHTGTIDESSSVEEVFIMDPASVPLHLVEAEFVGRLRCGYVRGAAEDILSSLEHFGLAMTVLSAEDLSYADLRMFDAIVVGPNAYVTQEEVRRNAARLLEYVEGGGTLIVQYQSYPYQAPGLAPYPFRFHQPHDRVTLPDAPVTVLEPDHSLLSFPNRITAEDFAGWIHDRGLYFFGEWDKRYVPLIETADPGEQPLRGGLLAASHGRGTYVYAALSFFRQIPAGVGGAIRLFANLLGLAEARILERAERVKHLPMFASMTEGQRYEVGRLMSERWLETGVTLCRQGDRGRELFMIVDGEVEILKGEPGGEKVVNVVGSGEVVGELAVLTDLPRSATLRAKTDVKLLVMDGVHFREFLRQHGDLAERMTSLLARKLASSQVAW
jgi:LmbE family N-acetylglucosaminyl deacetylase